MDFLRFFHNHAWRHKVRIHWICHYHGLLKKCSQIYSVALYSIQNKVQLIKPAVVIASSASGNLAHTLSTRITLFQTLGLLNNIGIFLLLILDCLFKSYYLSPSTFRNVHVFLKKVFYITCYHVSPTTSKNVQNYFQLFATFFVNSIGISSNRRKSPAKITRAKALNG